MQKFKRKKSQLKSSPLFFVFGRPRRVWRYSMNVKNDAADRNAGNGVKIRRKFEIRQRQG
ncbi:MAG: hypothetical protein WCS42_04665 [Verrucomicrobiota bacterium]